MKFLLRKIITLFLLLVPLNMISKVFQKIIYIKLEKNRPQICFKKTLRIGQLHLPINRNLFIILRKRNSCKKRLTKYVDYFTAHAKKIGGPCLDIGCGDGELAMSIAKQKIKITGIELSLEQIKKSQRKKFI